MKVNIHIDSKSFKIYDFEWWKVDKRKKHIHCRVLPMSTKCKKELCALRNGATVQNPLVSTYLISFHHAFKLLQFLFFNSQNQY